MRCRFVSFCLLHLSRNKHCSAFERDIGGIFSWLLPLSNLLPFLFEIWGKLRALLSFSRHIHLEKKFGRVASLHMGIICAFNLAAPRGRYYMCSTPYRQIKFAYPAGLHPNVKHSFGVYRMFGTVQKTLLLKFPSVLFV